MRIANLVGGIAVALGLSSAAQAAAILPSSYYPSYNVVTFGDFTSMYTDTEASIAAGGNVSLTGYSVASRKSGDAAKLVAGGSAKLTNGSVGQGGSGSIYAGTAVTTSSAGVKQTYVANQASRIVLPFDFTEAYATLTRASTLMTRTNAIGTVAPDSGGLKYTGLHTDSNTFNVTAAQFGKGQMTFNVPSGATIIVNVAGKTVSFPNGGQTFPQNIDATKIIYNFYEATSLALQSGFPVYGSILAPYAAVTGGYGQMNGQLFAKSYSGNTEFHDRAFNGIVPLPGGLPLATTGLVGLGAIGWLKRRKAAA